jgi:hypothetical protein
VNKTRVLFVVLVLVLTPFAPAAARADDWDDLDVTMEVVSDAKELDVMISEMDGPDEGAVEKEDSNRAVDGEFEEEMEEARNDEFEHDESESEEDELEREDDFEDGEDIDEDEYDDQGDDDDGIEEDDDEDE